MINIKNEKAKKVLFVPNWCHENPYQNLVKNACEEKNCTVIYDDYPSGEFLFSKLINKNNEVDVIHIHWISSIISKVTWSSSKLKFLLKCMLLVLDLLYCRVRGVKLIWTIHNKFAHENYNKKREIFIRKIFAYCVNKIILHSQEALIEVSKLYNMDLSSKSEIIFHGNFNGCYPEPSTDKKQLKELKNIYQNEKVILFFGALKPYKGIEILISTFNELKHKENLTLIIAGNPVSDEYKQLVVELTKGNDKIKTDLRFLSDGELVDYIDIADLVALPFSDTLTSSTVLLAMTQGKALLLPESARVFGCVPEKGVKYFSSSDNIAEYLQMCSTVELKEMGKRNKIVSDSMNWDVVGELTSNLYN